MGKIDENMVTLFLCYFLLLARSLLLQVKTLLLTSCQSGGNGSASA